MPGYTTISIEGVLADPTGEPSFAAAKFLQAGALIYHGLKGATKIVLLTDQQDQEKVDHWLKVHGFRDHVLLLYNPEPYDLIRGREELISEVRRRGSYELAVEAEDRYAARILSHGVSTLVVAHPTYTRAEFQPGEETTARPWSQVVEELDRQQAAHSEDERVTADVAGTKYE